MHWPTTQLYNNDQGINLATLSCSVVVGMPTSNIDISYYIDTTLFFSGIGSTICNKKFAHLGSIIFTHGDQDKFTQDIT